MFVNDQDGNFNVARFSAAPPVQHVYTSPAPENSVAHNATSLIPPAISTRIDQIELQAFSFNEPTILIVDDSPTDLKMLETILSSEGFRPLIARDGRDAYRLCCGEPPSLILLNLAMPAEIRLDTWSLLKANPDTAGIPVLFTTSSGDMAQRVMSLEAGGVDYICKPLFAAEVLARVRLHLRMCQSNQQMVHQHEEYFQKLAGVAPELRTNPWDSPNSHFAVFSKPFNPAGGDHWDAVIASSEVNSYFIASISGPGAGAEFFSAELMLFLRQYSSPLFSLADALRSIDLVTRGILRERILATCYARLNRRNRELSIVSSGAPPPVLLKASGKAQIAEITSDSSALLQHSVLGQRNYPFECGDRLFLYIDGFSKCPDSAGRQPGIEWLIESAEKHRAAPLEQAAQLIAQQLHPEDAPQTEDLLLLAAEMRP